MAFNYTSFNAISSLLTQISSQKSSGIPIRILSIGYPDFIVKRSVLNSSVHSQVLRQSVISNQSAPIEWHSLDPRKFVAISLFKALNLLYSLDSSYADIHSGTGASQKDAEFISLDLNKPLSRSMHPFDLILDSGTSEHCFNIPQVFITYHSLLASGGYLYQWSPFLSPNHGFYSLNPTFYFDLDRANIFNVESFRLNSYRNYRCYFECKSRSLAYRPTAKFRIWPWSFTSTILNEVLIKKGNADFIYPIQSKYLASP